MQRVPVLRVFWDLEKTVLHETRVSAESTKQMEEKLNFQVPAEGLKLVILLHTQY